MDVFLMIRRKKTTIFTEAKESSTVLELKHIIESILKRPPEEQQLFKDDQLLDDRKTLGMSLFLCALVRTCVLHLTASPGVAELHLLLLLNSRLPRAQQRRASLNLQMRWLQRGDRQLGLPGWERSYTAPVAV
ncbi:uncharacterized protein LOC116077726 isoform X1 [Mastomys coucha]|uniref:uncharacterized protein LOC116077726 isoform X1 n=1 Tax=Mastomys coucha TaxID=35658 RepID=UPI00126274EC|nr:uncharacterized protein LOC116077726 isoform X1 [Mastomys coucha]